MARNIKKHKVAQPGLGVNEVASLWLGLFIVLSVTLFLFTVVAPMSSVFAKHFKYKKPYASVLMDDEEADEECSEEECGAEDEEENATSVKETVKTTPPPAPVTKETTKEETKKESVKEPVIEEKKTPVKEKTIETTEKVDAKKKAAAEEAAKEQAAKEKELKQFEEKKKAEALTAEEKAKEMAELKRMEAEKKKLEEELKMKEEETKRLEELQKQAEAEALKRQEEELRRQKEEETRRQEELKRLSEETKLKELFVEQPLPVAAPLSTLITELKKAAGEDSEKVDLELVKKEAELAVKKAQSVEKEEVKPIEAERVFQEEFKKEKAKQIRKLIAKASERRHRVTIRDNREGLKTNGISHEVAVFLAPELAPTAQVAPQEQAVFAHPVEKKLFGVPQNKTIDQLAKPTVGLPQGTTVATRGTAILAAVPEANKPYELHAIDTSGRSRIIGKQMSSENKKLVFTTSTLPPGKYALQVRPVSALSGRFPYFASTLSAGVGAASDPILIEAKSDPGVPQPVVESIEGLSIAGLRDIQVEAGADGKITVSGASDVTTMVIGTFSSAVFTSAMLADIDTGRFEVVSPRSLEAGDHEVVIYASRPEEAAQSVPVKVKFRLVQVAKAEAPGVAGPIVVEPAVNHSAAPEKKFPIVPFLAFGGLAVLLIGIGIFLKKNRRPN